MIAELARLDRSAEAGVKDRNDLRVQLAVLTVKTAIWSAVVGAVGGALAALAVWMAKQ